MVSVVVAARDDERTIAACLESIGRLRYPNYEVIVVDDGSRDRTADLAAGIGGAGPIRVLRERRAGTAAAMNAAVRAARGHLIAFTRADCTVDQDWLALSVRVMLEGRLEGCRGPLCATPEPAAISGARDRIASAPAIERPRPRSPLVILTDRNMIVRKASLIAVGGFDPRFIEGGADADLSARMIEAQMTLGWCPAGLVWCDAIVGVLEFHRRRIGRGRADAMLAVKHPGWFGRAAGQTCPPAAIDDLMIDDAAVARGLDGSNDRRVIRGLSHGLVRGLCALLSVSGAMVQSAARHHYQIAASHSAAGARANGGDEYDPARHLPVAKNQPHPAAPR